MVFSKNVKHVQPEIDCFDRQGQEASVEALRALFEVFGSHHVVRLHTNVDRGDSDVTASVVAVHVDDKEDLWGIAYSEVDGGLCDGDNPGSPCDQGPCSATHIHTAVIFGRNVDQLIEALRSARHASKIRRGEA